MFLMMTLFGLKRLNTFGSMIEELSKLCLELTVFQVVKQDLDGSNAEFVLWINADYAH